SSRVELDEGVECGDSRRRSKLLGLLEMRDDPLDLWAVHATNAIDVFGESTVGELVELGVQRIFFGEAMEQIHRHSISVEIVRTGFDHVPARSRILVRDDG